MGLEVQEEGTGGPRGGARHPRAGRGGPRAADGGRVSCRAGGPAADGRTPMNYDFGELCTQCVREVLPAAHAKGLGCSSTCAARSSCPAAARAPCGAACTACCARRSTAGAGLPGVPGDAALRARGKCQLSVTVAGNGRVAEPRAVTAVLDRLGCRSAAPTCGCGARAACAPRPARASSSPACRPGAAVHGRADRRPGRGGPSEPSAEAHRARAWVVDADDVGADALVARLQRLGWTVSRPSRPAMRCAGCAVRGAPALLVMADSPAVGPDHAQKLAGLMPPWTRCLYAAWPARNASGSTTRCPASTCGCCPSARPSWRG